MRQLLEQGGMYGLEKPIGDMKFIADTRYLAAMNAPGAGGRAAWPWLAVQLRLRLACGPPA